MRNNLALYLISKIRQFPDGRKDAIQWLLDNGVTEIGSGSRKKKVANGNHDNSDFICTQDLCIAIAQKAIQL